MNETTVLLNPSLLYDLTLSRDWEKLLRCLEELGVGDEQADVRDALLSYRGSNGRNLLHEAVALGAPAKVVKALGPKYRYCWSNEVGGVDHDISTTDCRDILIRQYDSHGETPLHVAGRVLATGAATRALLIDERASGLGEDGEEASDGATKSKTAAMTPVALLREEGRGRGTALHCAAALDVETYENAADNWLGFVRAVLDACPAAASAVDPSGLTPLHLACANTAAPYPIVEALHAADPGSASIADRAERTALHYAARRACDGDNDELLQKVALLAEACPQSALMQDEDGRTPLHSSLFWMACPAAVRLLLEFCPQAVWTVNKVDRLNPLALLHQMYSDTVTNALSSNFFRPNTPSRGTFNMRAASVLAMWDVASLLVQTMAYGTPRGGVTRSDAHAALRIPAGDFEQECPLVIAWLSTYLFPTSLKESDDRGDLPLHLAAINVPKRTDGGDLSKMKYGRWVESGYVDVPANIIDDLVERYREGARRPNRDGRLPLGLLIDSGATWKGGIRAVFEAYPRAVLVEGIDVRCVCYLLAKIGQWKSHDERSGIGAIFELLRDMPPDLTACVGEAC